MIDNYSRQEEEWELITEGRMPAGYDVEIETTIDYLGDIVGVIPEDESILNDIKTLTSYQEDSISCFTIGDLRAIGEFALRRSREPGRVKEGKYIRITCEPIDRFRIIQRIDCVYNSIRYAGTWGNFNGGRNHFPGMYQFLFRLEE